MKKTARLAAAGIAAAVATAGLTVAPAQAAPGTTSLAEVLDADGNNFDRNWDDFDIVDRAVRFVLKKKPGSAVAVLADGDTKLTAFIPTDRAFRRLVADLTGDRPMREKPTWKVVKSLGADTVEAVLLYHVIAGEKINRKTAEQADGAVLTTAGGGTIEVDVRGHKIVLKDQDPNDLNPRVIRKLSDINKGNKQIAHGISRVLRPMDL
ncbi:fasciclin domain-containing protein [Nocardioides sp. GCM10027113]|uniref:fasciclin domain-containing protein n=1 Tax=unclassified Nocardioides TaxID=2615069 RepID=UPI0036111D2C